VLEKESRQGGFEQRGEDIAVARKPIELLGWNDPIALFHEPGTEIELAGNDRAARARDDCERILASRPS
jgi:hypothetical protein